MLTMNQKNIIPRQSFLLDLILHLFNTYDFLDLKLQPYLTQMMEGALDKLTTVSLENWV